MITNPPRFAMPRRLLTICLSASVLSAIPWMAQAGPPFATDDPEPTDTGHWEIYAPFVEASGKGSNYDGAIGVELNYGAARNLQLTVGLPANYTHDSSGFHFSRGDLELSAKYRFYHNDSAGISIATFPGLTLPTASHGAGNSKVTGLLPLWIQKDAGPWSIFGGGGFAINPGAGNRDYWLGGVAVTRAISDRFLLGVEVDRQGPDAVGGRGSTSVGIGTIFNLKAPFRLLASGGPVFTDGERPASFHAFMALGLDL